MSGVRCPECGIINPKGQPCAYCASKRAPAAEAPAAPKPLTAAEVAGGLSKALGAYGLINKCLICGAGGVVMLALAGMLLFNPDLRSDPQGLSARDVFTAVGPFLVGLLLLAVAYLALRELLSGTARGGPDDISLPPGLD